MDIQKILDELRANSQIHKVSESTINRTLSNKAKVNDPVWLNAVQENNSKPKSEQWHENHKKGTTEMWQDDTFLTNWKNGVERAKNDAVAKQNRKNGNLKQEKRKKHSEKMIGKGNSFYKGDVLGTHIKTGDTIRFSGAKAMKDAGFLPGEITACILGRAKSHHGYTWVRLAPEE